MLTKSFRSVLFAGIAGAFLLSACSGDQPEVTFETDPPVLQEVPPAGQLPEGVTPTAYRLSLNTDPAADGFTGQVEIDVTLDEPHARIWLHSLDQRIAIAKARLADGSELEAEFTRSTAEGGVSRLDFAPPVPAGNATLIIEYSAPYNFGLAGLY